MSKINQDELYRHLCQFLTTKGVEFREGAYTRRVRRACSLLTDTINLADRAVKRAKTKVDATLTQVRQTIHENTAPKTPPAEPPPAEPPPAEPPPPPPAEKTATVKRPSARKKSVPPKSKRTSPKALRPAH